jgi:hypothetical protein
MTLEREEGSTYNDEAKEPVSTVTSTDKDKGGRPSKYTPETLERLIGAINDGLSLKQSCLAAGISEATLGRWREEHPELEPQLTEAREVCRQKALANIRAAGNAGDWRASAEFLRLSFPKDYRQGSNTRVEVAATAQTGVVITEEQRKRLIELRVKMDEERQREIAAAVEAERRRLGGGAS